MWIIAGQLLVWAVMIVFAYIIITAWADWLLRPLLDRARDWLMAVQARWTVKAWEIEDRLAELRELRDKRGNDDDGDTGDPAQPDLLPDVPGVPVLAADIRLSCVPLPSGAEMIARLGARIKVRVFRDEAAKNRDEYVLRSCVVTSDGPPGTVAVWGRTADGGKPEWVLIRKSARLEDPPGTFYAVAGKLRPDAGKRKKIMVGFFSDPGHVESSGKEYPGIG